MRYRGSILVFLAAMITLPVLGCGKQETPRPATPPPAGPITGGQGTGNAEPPLRKLPR